MEIVKNRLFLYGFFSAFFATSFAIVVFTLIFSEGELFESLHFLYLQNKLGGVISIGALLNLPLFYLAIRKQKFPFATGVVIFSLILVLIVALLKGI